MHTGLGLKEAKCINDTVEVNFVCEILSSSMLLWCGENATAIIMSIKLMITQLYNLFSRGVDKGGGGLGGLKPPSDFSEDEINWIISGSGLIFLSFFL